MGQNALSTFPAYDDKRRWGKPELWRQPGHIDVAYWQSRINDIFGSVNGEPIIRLTWAWEPQEFFHTEWDNFGRGIKGELRPRYEFLSVPIAGNRTLPVCAPRWVLEEREEPAQFRYRWEAARWLVRPGSTIVDPAGQPVSNRLDLRGEPPPGAHYVFARYVARHRPNKTCCDEAFRTGQGVCFGYYREPDEQMLELLRQAKAQHDADDLLRVDPHKPIEQQADVLTQIEREAEQQVADEAAHRNQQLDDIYRPFMAAHGWRAFTDSYKKLKHGKWQNAFPLTEFKGDNN